MREYIFYVYILQSASRRALYIGMTNNLRHRAFQHKTHQSEGFTDEYNAIRLVYWEKFGSVGKAIAREKQLKRWRREKKNWLVETINIFGVPFTFLPHEGTGDGPPPPPPSPKTRVEAMPDRKAYEIVWPNMIRIDHEYRPQLTLDRPNAPLLILDAYDNVTIAELAPMIEGKPDVTRITEINLRERGEEFRMQKNIFRAATYVFDQMQSTWRGSPGLFIGAANPPG